MSGSAATSPFTSSLQRLNRFSLPFKLNKRRYTLKPTWYGFVFSAMITALLVGSINHNNNLGFLLTFLLGGIMAVSLITTFRNLDGIRITQPPPPPVFAGRVIDLPLVLMSEETKTGIIVSLLQSHSLPVNIAPGKPANLIIPLQTTRRGLIRVEPVHVSTTFPLGLFAMQTQLEVPVSLPVYPAPLKCDLVTEIDGISGNERHQIKRIGENEFSELTPYRYGDDIRRAHWKSLAKGKELHTEKFDESHAGGALFSLALLQGSELEKKISQLCYMILYAESTSMDYGLRLGDLTISKGRGVAHRNDCLKALALFKQ